MKKHLEFAWYRALAELQADISRAVLGLFWWLFEPLMNLFVFYLVFAVILHRGDENYVSFLLIGLIIWKWFATTVSSATVSITRNMPIIQQVYLPKYVFPLIALITSSLKFFVVLLVLLLFLTISGIHPTTRWLVDLPLLLLIQALLMFGIAMIVSAIVPLIPDVKFIVDNGMSMLFFLSGIFFPLNSVPTSLQSLFNLNPIGVLIHLYREVLIDGNPITWASCVSLVSSALFFLAIGIMLLQKFDKTYAKRVVL